MRWEEGDESGNVEDRRGQDDGSGGGGGGGGLPFRPTHIGIGGIIVMLVVSWILGVNPLRLVGLLGSGNGGGQPSPTQVAPSQAPGGREDRAHKFVATILRYTEKVWDERFRAMGRTYEKPHLVMFSGQTRSGCGPANEATGPFYCPADRTVYVDPAFFDELSDKLGGSKADFSAAYVLAHEVGHHVQTLLGYGELVDEKRRTLPEAEFNRWSVRLELQADYLAGVWAHYGQEDFHFMESGDLEEALKSANAIGDDSLQRKFNGRVSPQRYTHGTSAQRVKWYRRGFETGDMSQLKAIF